MPNVVHADQDTEYIGLHRKAVLLPSIGELKDLMPTDATIENAKLPLGAPRQERSGGHPRIAMAKSGLEVWLSSGFSTATGVGDRVPLKQDRVSHTQHG